MAIARGIVSHTGLSRREAVVTNLSSALLGGQLSGVVFLALLMLASAVFLGRSALSPLQLAGAALLGPGALDEPTGSSVLVGFLVNQAGPALFWSAVYGVISAFSKRRMDLNQSLMLGFILGGVAELVDVYWLCHGFENTALWLRGVPKLWDWLAHVSYGLSLGAFFYVLRNQLETSRLIRRGVARKAP